MCQCEQWNRSQALAEPVSSSDMQSGTAIASGASLTESAEISSLSQSVCDSVLQRVLRVRALESAGPLAP
jgi:hypothetical protein